MFFTEIKTKTMSKTRNNQHLRQSCKYNYKKKKRVGLY